MRILASNEKAALLKSGRMYWVVRIVKMWQLTCVNEQSETYNAINALAFFEEHFGKATWSRPNLRNF